MASSKCQLGGIFQKSYIVETSETDTETSVEATLKGEFGNGLVDCSAEASVGTKQTKHNANASMRIEQECLGGDSSIWLGATADNADEIQAKWADSVQPDNLYALDMHLHFAWEIVTALNPTLGGNYKKYLQEKWEKQKVNTNDLSHIAVSRFG